MDDTIDLRDISPAADPSTSSLEDSDLVSQLEAAYAARLHAVLHGSEASLATARQRAETMERAWLERRRVRGLVLTAASRDPSYYLG